MKSYLFSLLLFLLLLHNSLSAPFRLPPKTFTTKQFKEIKDIIERGKDVLEKLLERLKDKSESPPSPSRPPLPVEIKGLSLVKHYDSPAAAAAPTPVVIEGLYVLKQYFYDLGYINFSDPFTDYLDNETISAIITYQHFFNHLKVNGQLDNDTLNQISLPRCAVPDLNFTYDLTTTNNLSWPKGKWFPNDTKLLTYAFLPDSKIPSNAKNVFRDAFHRWSEAFTEMNLTEKLNFTETTYRAADIKIGFYQFDESIEDVVVGGTIMRFQGNKVVGDMRLDATKYWALPGFNGTLSWEKGQIDLETAAMHQIGHLLGLSHSSDNQSVMYPSILPASHHNKVLHLTDDDKSNIQQLYTHQHDDKNNIHQLNTHTTNNSGYAARFTLFSSSTLLLTTLSLRFLLFY